MHYLHFCRIHLSCSLTPLQRCHFLRLIYRISTRYGIIELPIWFRYSSTCQGIGRVILPWCCNSHVYCKVRLLQDIFGVNGFPSYSSPVSVRAHYFMRLWFYTVCRIQFCNTCVSRYGIPVKCVGHVLSDIGIGSFLHYFLTL